MSKAYPGIIIFLVLLCVCLLAFIIYGNRQTVAFFNPLNPKPRPADSLKPLQKYAFPNLANYAPAKTTISLSEIIDQKPEYTTYRFTYGTEGKSMSGQLNVPNLATPSSGFPVVLMLRGFVDQSIYETGTGTKNAAAVFTKNGYVTLAPDFLGFGQSDPPDNDVMGERLQKPLHILDLIASIPSLPFINQEKLFMWAHSNGGQIALSVLEVSGKPIPTTLWAPVSKPFPYSILYYTDEAEDQGKALRRKLALFEMEYDVFDYSIERFYAWINAPLQIHQGTADEAVPLKWSSDLAHTLQAAAKDVTLFTYPGADHNLKPSWDTAIVRDLTFFKNFTQD